jgi:hypothetical protein
MPQSENKEACQRPESPTGQDSTQQSGNITSASWFKAFRTPDALQLIEANPDPFILLYVIAHRARWKTDGFNPRALELGEAEVGDYERYGMTERRYRTAKKCLEKWKIATFKGTNKGTLARLVNTTFFSVSNFADDEQNDRQATDSRRASDGQATTNIKRIEGIEGKQTHSAERPSEAEVQAFAQRIGLAPWKALDWFNEMEGCGWLDHQHRPIANWQAVLTRVKTKWEADGRPSAPPSILSKASAPNNPAKPAEQNSVWQLKQRLDAVNSEITAFRAANGHEDALGWHPRNDAARAGLRTLITKRKELQQKMANQ